MGARKLEYYQKKGALEMPPNFDFEVLESSKPRKKEVGRTYQYGFNGQERVDEVSGSGAHTTAPFWEYDTRAVHRWNLDPRPNTSFSPYAIMQGNPIMYSDHLGDSVNYAGLGDRLRVGAARLLGGKAFRDEFRKLKNDERTFTFNRSHEKSNLEADGVWECDCEGGFKKVYGSDQNITINYRFGKDIGDDRKTPIGKSPFHDLFEETYHATDYISGTSGQKISPYDGTLYYSWGRIHGEGKAWRFAAKNAPFTDRFGGYYRAEGQKFYFTAKNTLIGRILGAKDIGEAGRILFTPQIFISEENEFGNKWEIPQEKATYE